MPEITHHKEGNQGWWLWSLNPLSLMLWPLSIIFCLLVWIRYRLYQSHYLRSSSLNKPVIVIGNITVGGSGKTPVVHAVVKMLQQRGLRPAILTRGYKSDFEQQILILNSSEISPKAGDEANMLAELCACPLAIGADRVSSAKELLQTIPDIDVLIADDGLQHYAMQRDIEIVVERRLSYGNGFCLPAGPLREPRRRLQDADLIVDRDAADVTELFGRCWNLQQPDETRALESFKEQEVYALAGIGFPDYFFDRLSAAGLQVEGHAFADHHVFSSADICNLLDKPLLVTHKDAVKLRHLVHPDIWVVPLELTLSDDLQSRLFTLLESRLHG